MSSGLRKHLKKLPWFLLYNYPKKLEAYEKIREHNKALPKDQWIEPNAYRSASPMNELCDYINTWEKEKIKWNTEYIDTRYLTVNADYPLNDRAIRRTIKNILSSGIKEMNRILDGKDDNDQARASLDQLYSDIKKEITSLCSSEEEGANYAISIIYSSAGLSKSIVWAIYSNYILKNITDNSNPKKNYKIIEVPYSTTNSYDFLGKYYELERVADV